MLTELRTVVLSKNLICHISGLETLVHLENLDLSENSIETVSGLSCLPNLKTLNLSGNRMKSTADVQHLAECTALSSLDLAGCKLREESTIDMIITWPLAFLRLQGNPVVSTYK